MAFSADRNFFLRVGSAAVLLPLLILVILWRQTWAFGALALLAGAVGLSEYGAMMLQDWPRGRRAVVVVGVLLSVGLYLRPDWGLVCSMGAVVLMGAVTVTGVDDISRAAVRLGLAVLGVFYVGGLIVALPLLQRDVPDGPLWVLAAVAVTFANDTGAYFSGRALGRHKLAPAISPGKTVEGAVGGLVTSLLVMVVAQHTFFPGLVLADALIIGAVAGVLGPVGDLFESLLKRSVGAKDSGKLIPGHGGMLDRIDALLFVGAYVYIHAVYLRVGL